MHNKKPILFMTAFLAFSAMAVGCKDSGSSVNDDSTSVDANHEHAFDKKVVNEAYLSHEATCEEAAEYYYSCSCGAKGTETFSFGEKTGHQFDYSHWHSDEFTHWHESTCGHEVKADEGNHVFDQFIANENTFAVSGNCDHGTLYYVSCVCGKLGTATFEGGQLGDHPFDDEWKSDATGHWHESKCYHGVKKDFAEHTMEFVKVLHFGGDNDSLYKCSICGYEEARANDPLQILSVEIEHEYESDSDITADSTVRMTLKTNLQEDIPLTLPDGSIDIPIQSNFVESVTKNPTCEEDGVISFVPNNKLLFLKYVQNGTRDENGDSRISLVTLKSIIDVLWEEDQFHINFAYCAYGHDIKLVATADHSDCGGQALKQHFECSKCHKCFSDSSGSNPVSRESLEDSNDFIFFVEDAMHWTGRGTLVRGKARTDGKELVGKNYYLYGMDGFKYSDKITYVLFDDTSGNSLIPMSTEEQKSIKAGDSIMLVLRGIHGSNVYSGSYVTDSPTFHNCFADDCIDETTGICNRCGNFLGVDNISQYHDFINDVYSKYYFIHNGTYNLYFRTIAVPYLHKMYLDWDNLDIYSDGHAYSDGKEIGDGIFDPNSYGYGAIREYNAANPVRSPITYVVSVDSTAVDGAEECFYGGCGPCDDYDASNDFFECRYCTYSYTEELHEPTWNYGDSAGFNTFLISEPYMAYAYSLKLSSSCKIKFGKGNSDADYKLEFYMDHTLIATMDKGVSEFITSTLPAGEYTLIARSDEAQEDMSKTNVGKTLGFAYGLAN